MEPDVFSFLFLFLVPLYCEQLIHIILTAPKATLGLSINVGWQLWALGNCRIYSAISLAIFTQIKLKLCEIWAQEGVLAYSQEFSTKTLFKSIETLLNGDVFTYKPSKE